MIRQGKLPVKGWLVLTGKLFLAALLSCLFFVSLYKFDNKYAQTAKQPIGGVLMLDAAEYAAHPIRCLSREWAFYPGVLLSPADFADGTAAEHYMQYVSAGQYGGLEAGNPYRSNHGSATYRLILSLPDEPHDYAIEMSEVYSACRLYINGIVELELGEPELQGYRTALKNAVVTFRASGQTELVLAVSDMSGFYSGMVYPVAFGEPELVINTREIRLFLHDAPFFLALIGLALSFFVWIRTKRPDMLLFMLTCVCLIGSTAYPLLRSYFALPLQPWYALELACTCLMPMLIILLHGRLNAFPVRRSLLFAAPAGVGALVTVLSCVLINERSSWLMAVSVAVSVVRIYEALYLMAASVPYIKKEKHVSLFFLASLFFALSLLFDRLLPLYEPIFGGWFPEYGGAAVVVAFTLLIWRELSEAYKKRLLFESDRIQISRQLALQEAHYRALDEQIEETRKARHDLKQHVRLLQGFAAQGDYAAMAEYIAALEPPASVTQSRTYSNNRVADALLYYYAGRAEQSGIQFTAAFTVPETFDLPDDALCVLLGNLLDNALEACQRQPVGQPRRITLNGKPDAAASRVLISIRNTYNGAVREKDGLYLSSKRADFGIGTQSVHAVVERLGGIVQFEAGVEWFAVTVMLPG